MAEYIVSGDILAGIEGSISNGELIRCKDCIFLGPTYISINMEPIRVCNIHNSYPDDDYFCADAIRREENE